MSISNTSEEKNCLQFDHGDSLNCLVCQDGFFIKQNKYYIDYSKKYYDGCQECIIKFKQNLIDKGLGTCLVPANEQECSICADGFSLISDNLKQCFEDGTCVTTCGVGYYGKKVFDERGLQTNKTFGQCLAKIDLDFEGKIYVDPYFSFPIPSNEEIESYQNTYRTIQEAVTKGYELGAKYLNAKIYIELKAGENQHHAMLRQITDSQLPKHYDHYQQSTRIVIDTEDKQPQLVLYKMRDKWRFNVKGGLTIRNLVFDAVDSTIIPTRDKYHCLENGLSNCCESTSCNGQEEVLTLNCEVPNFGTFINFDSDKSFSLERPQTLIIQSIGSLKKTISQLFVNSTYQSKLYGSILDLEDFRGEVKIMANKYPSLGNKSEVKIHSLISITNHSHNVELIDNIFEENSGTRGIIDLDINRKNNNKILIALNQFKHNFGFSESTVIYINHRVGILYQVDLLMQNQIQDGFCSGFHLIQNNFLSNLGCPLYSGGLIRYQCLENNQDPININESYPLSMPNINLNLIEFDWIEKQNQTLIYEEISLEYDLNMNSLQSNIYYGNYGTGGKGLISIYGSLRLQLDNEVFNKNGESCNEVHLIQKLNRLLYNKIG
ncbi:UNKNOWN [Stylonychia lemnae]|uniref:Uncharacterized protein n=1 Tax=Stylonychia lemnae TaxID=5949 RepID=A0A078A7P6_STYLE|nr:UNKNOWN [Stylonychia lemnae]|eukprot:CDW78280.1 UNKNOWN [Stylonychia lemnae]